ncbi:MAG: winged helix-turn-helix domain-containing protein [Thiohalomonadales bacterium]
MLKQLQKIALHSQGLNSKTPFGNDNNSGKQIFEKLRYIQIDTLSIVERAHHHTLWSRFPKYTPSHLQQLVKDGLIFEYWSHAASYLPMRDYRYALPKMSSIKRGESGHFLGVDKKLENIIYERIRQEGPLKARDFKSSRNQKGSWWNWKPAKLALEKLFMQGDLMICGRNGMEKIYDITERVLPSKTDTREPDILDYARYLVDSTISAHGFATIKHISHLRSGAALRQSIQKVISQKLESEELCELGGSSNHKFFTSKIMLNKKITIPSSNMHILSPFDNFLIHRERINDLFDFDYRLECYLPKPKRQYGYFCLPLLYKDKIVGSIDCKAHRNEKRLEVIFLHIRKNFIPDDKFIALFTKKLVQFSLFNDCKTIKITDMSPKKFRPEFRRELTQAGN